MDTATSQTPQPMHEVDFVFDANVVMSILIGGKSWWLSLIAGKWIYAPDYMFDELLTHNAVVRAKTKFSDQELSRFTIALFEQITVLPRLVLPEKTLIVAQELCQDVDDKDVSYVALSSYLDFPLVTRDKPLLAGLRKKGFRNVISLDGFLNLL